MPAERIAMRRIREVLRLKHECGLSYESIARSLGISKGSVANYLVRAENAGLSHESARALDDAESRQVVNSLVKQRRDSIEQFMKGGRQDLVDKETAEIAILEQYLPPPADPAALERAVAEAIAETGAASPKDMGRVMKAAMARLSGQSVDGRLVNDLVKKKLAGA